MYTVVIGDEEEYGRRLVRYLETHMPRSVRLNSFTDPEVLLRCEERADAYLLGEDFYEELREKQGWKLEGRVILLTQEEHGDGFCRFHNPGELRDKVTELLEQTGYHRMEEKGQDVSSLITCIFSPIYEPALRQFALKCMEPGEVYLGMEDLGAEDWERSNMADLCYYIHLREERILERMRELLYMEQEKYYLDSPGLYFDLLELGEEDYQWFFQRIKVGGYPQIYVGMGPGVFGYLYPLPVFDRIILVDSRDDVRLRGCCERLEQKFKSENYLRGKIFSRMYREDMCV